MTGWRTATGSWCWPSSRCILIVAFDAQTTRLIQLYIVGVFVSFNLSQLGMIRHWTRHLKTETDPAARRRMHRSRMINTFGLGMTLTVFIIILLTKFLAGAWISILAMCAFFALMRGIRRHYDKVNLELAADEEDRFMPTKVHAVVLVSKLHKPTLRALAYAKATRPNVLEAVYVSSDDATTKALVQEWDDRNLGVPLKVLYSPYREIVRPIVEYAIQIRKASPRGVVAVYIPEYVVGRWWEQLLHNQTALRLKGKLLFTPGVMVTSVPYQLESSQIARDRARREASGSRPETCAAGRSAAAGGCRRTSRSTDDRRPVSRRRTRERAPRGASHVGERFEAEVGPIAHGGHCVVRHDERVVFVRHALPGERVVVSVTEGSDGDRFWRGDAVSVVSASRRPGRPALPVRRAGAAAAAATSSTSSAAAQRSLKSDVVREQLSRLAGLDLDVAVEEVPPLLRWRTRMRYVALPGGARGLHVHRSDEVVEIDDCLIDAGRGSREVETVATSYGTHDFRVDPDGFWQSHVDAPRVLVETVLGMVAPRPGETVLDLYAGVGLFAAFLADAVGPPAGWWPSRGRGWRAVTRGATSPRR